MSIVTITATILILFEQLFNLALKVAHPDCGANHPPVPFGPQPGHIIRNPIMQTENPDSEGHKQQVLYENSRERIHIDRTPGRDRHNCRYCRAFTAGSVCREETCPEPEHKSGNRRDGNAGTHRTAWGCAKAFRGTSEVFQQPSLLSRN
jgi:hypothetical protein